MRTLTDYDIKMMMKPYGTNFLGVDMENEVPPSVGKTGRYAVTFNLERCNQSGSHWVTVLIDNKTCKYIDSYGVVAPRDVLKWMKTLGRRIQYNKYQIQALQSTSCGWFSIYFMQLWLNGNKINDILATFSDPETNERMLKSYFAR